MKNLHLLSKTLILIAFCTITNCKNIKKETSPEPEPPKKATFVLVHSAWLGAWQWGEVQKTLTEAGHTVIAPDLPGHGLDKTLPA